VSLLLLKTALFRRMWYVRGVVVCSAHAAHANCLTIDACAAFALLIFSVSRCLFGVGSESACDGDFAPVGGWKSDSVFVCFSDGIGRLQKSLKATDIDGLCVRLESTSPKGSWILVGLNGRLSKGLLLTSIKESNLGSSDFCKSAILRTKAIFKRNCELSTCYGTLIREKLLAILKIYYFWVTPKLL
jgi:hypothetical protein